MREVVSGMTLMQKEAFPDMPISATWQPGCAAERHSVFCLLLIQHWYWQMQEQVSLAEVLRLQGRVCAVLGEENSE